MTKISNHNIFHIAEGIISKPAHMKRTRVQSSSVFGGFWRGTSHWRLPFQIFTVEWL